MQLPKDQQPHLHGQSGELQCVLPQLQPRTHTHQSEDCCLERRAEMAVRLVAPRAKRPDAHGLVIGARGQVLAVWEESHTFNYALVPRQLTQARAVRHAPQPHNFVARRRRQLLAARRER